MLGVGSLLTTGPVACKDGSHMFKTIVKQERTRVTYSNVDLLEESLKCFIDIATTLCTHFIE